MAAQAGQGFWNMLDEMLTMRLYVISLNAPGGIGGFL
jgi:hypothetical protein